MSRTSKLAELRAKTDRQLVGIINQQLEFALYLARMAEDTNSSGDFDSARADRFRAEKTYTDVAQLLSKVDDLDERQRLEHKLSRLGGVLAVAEACSSAVS